MSPSLVIMLSLLPLMVMSPPTGGVVVMVNACLVKMFVIYEYIYDFVLFWMYHFDYFMLHNQIITQFFP